MNILPKRKPSLYEVEDFSFFRELLENAVSQAGDTVAVKYKSKGAVRDVTYNELLNHVNALGTALTLLPGEYRHTAILLPNGFPFITVFLAAVCSNDTAVPIDYQLPFTQIVNILNHSDADTFFFDRALLEKVKEYQKNLPKIKNYICVGLKEHEEQDDGILSFSGLVERGQSALQDGNDRFLSFAPGDRGTRLIIYKSGSDDTLLGVMLSQLAMKSAVKGFLQLNVMGQRCLSVLPYDRPTELICGLLASFHCHATVCLNVSLKTFQKDLSDYKPDYMFLPPLYVENIWQKLASSIERGKRTDTFETLVKTSNAMRKVGIDKRRSFFSAIHDQLGGNLRKIFVCGAAIDPEAVKFFDDIGISVLSGYGVSECAAIVSENREDHVNSESAGVLLPCMQAKIDDPNSSDEGEICLRGDMLMTGYYKNDRATKAAIDPLGWYHTGDIGKIGENGEIYITGRLKNEINLKSGRCVLPDEIESYLRALPFVMRANVYAGKDARGAEIHLCADIAVDQKSFEGASPEERIAIVKEKIDRLNEGLPSYKRVKVVHIKKQ